MTCLTEGRLEMTPIVTKNDCGFSLWAHILTQRSFSPFFPSNIDLLLPSHNKLLWKAGEMLLPVSVTVASQISLGGYCARGQQINRFRHKSISTLRVWSVYCTACPWVLYWKQLMHRCSEINPWNLQWQRDLQPPLPKIIAQMNKNENLNKNRNKLKTKEEF